MPKPEEELEQAIRNAEKFHGHLGPFLVIGVRMGTTVRKILQADTKKETMLEIVVSVPLVTPFSCVIDGIQVTTQCTIGNQKLKTENSNNEITAHARARGSPANIRITVNPRITKTLIDRISEGTPNETLAREIARLPEAQLFVIDKR